MNWQEVIDRTDIVGGELETREDGCVYRAPIERVELKGDLLCFYSPWCARIGEDGWEKHDINPPVFINTKEIQPQDIGEGRVLFMMPFLGHATIFPKGGSRLDPAKVRGLNLTEVSSVE